MNIKSKISWLLIIVILAGLAPRSFDDISIKNINAEGVSNAVVKSEEVVFDSDGNNEDQQLFRVPISNDKQKVEYSIGNGTKTVLEFINGGNKSLRVNVSVIKPGDIYANITSPDNCQIYTKENEEFLPYTIENSNLIDADANGNTESLTFDFKDRETAYSIDLGQDEMKKEEIKIKWTGSIKDNYAYLLINKVDFAGKFFEIKYYKQTSTDIDYGDPYKFFMIKSLKSTDEENRQQIVIEPTDLRNENNEVIDKRVIDINDNMGEIAGKNPGIRYKFLLPQTLNTTTMRYEYSDELFGEMLSFNIGADMQYNVLLLKADGNTSDNDDENIDITGNQIRGNFVKSGKLDVSAADADGEKVVNFTNIIKTNEKLTTYRYNENTHEFILEISKEKPKADYAININESLEVSKIYDTNSVSYTELLQYNNAAPTEMPTDMYKNEFMYTYPEYTVKRANVDEGQIVVTPYFSSNLDFDYSLYSSTAVFSVIPEKLPSLESREGSNFLLNYKQDSGLIVSKINIPITVKYKDNNTILYQMYVDTHKTTTKIKSQIIQYIKNENIKYPPTVPDIKKYGDTGLISGVSNLSVVPPEQADDNNILPENISFDLSWAIINKADYSDKYAYKKELTETIEDELSRMVTNEKRLFYEVSVGKSAELYDRDGNKNYKTIRLYEVTTDDDKTYNMENVLPGSSNIGDNEKNSFQVGVPEFLTENLDIIEANDGIKLNCIDSLESEYELEYDKENQTYSYKKVGTDVEENIFEYPGINYIRVRAITTDKVGTETNGKVTFSDAYVSEYSMPQSITLDLINVSIPIVQPKERLVEDRDYVNIIWESADVANYEKYMLEPVNKVVKDGELKYKVYISENKNSLLNIDESKVKTVSVLDTPEKDNTADCDFSEHIQNLRGNTDDGKNIVCYEIVAGKDSRTIISTGLKGLDKNGNYFVRVQLNMDVVNKATGDGLITQKGDLSDVVNITFPDQPPNPDKDDEIPGSPENFKVNVDTEKNTTIWNWSMPEGFSLAEGEFGIEVLSLEDSRLSENLESRDDTIEDIMQNSDVVDRNPLAYRIYKVLDENDNEKFEVIKYDGSNWVKQANAKILEVTSIDETYIKEAIEKYSDAFPILIKSGDDMVFITDQTNSSNTVVYYYVRAINMSVKTGTDGNKVYERGAASNWALTTYTTSPIASPDNIDIVYNGDYVKGKKVSFDATDAIMISVDVPKDIGSSEVKVYIKPNDGTQVENGVGYYEAKDDADEYTLESKGTDSEVGDLKAGYHRIYYKISNLAANTEYSIKTQIDIVETITESDGDKVESHVLSAFSGVVVTRTEFNQDEYDNDEALKKYLELYDKKAAEIHKKVYYKLREDDKESIVKYRADYVQGDLMVNSNGTYDLVAFDKDINTYYLPSEMLESINDLQISLQITENEEEFIIKPYSIGKVITDEINDLVEVINEKNGEIEDYYAKITFTTGEYNKRIAGNTPTSKLVDVSINIIPAKKTEESLEISIRNRINLVIANERSDLRIELIKQLKEGIVDKKLTALVNEAVEKVNKSYMAYAKRTMEEHLKSTLYPLLSLAKPIQIGITPTEKKASNVVMRKIGVNWENINSTYYNDKLVLDSDKLGSFISVKFSGAGNIEDFNKEQMDIINKYKLYEVFADNELKRTETNILYGQAISTYARLLGATDINDDIQFLKDKGIDVPRKGLYNITDKETINYLYVQVYALKNNIGIKDIVISNYDSVEDIEQVNTEYRNIITRGVNLEIIDTDDGFFYPQKRVDVLEFISSIDNIE